MTDEKTLHVFEADDDSDGFWIVAHDAAEAKRRHFEAMGEDPDDYPEVVFVQLDDDKPLKIWDEDGETSTTKPAGEWARDCGLGFEASTCQ